jgi:hypothetical protein
MIANTTGLDMRSRAISNVTTLTTSANANIGSGVLFVDNTNSRVGVGTVTPGYKFHVSSGSAGAVTATAAADDFVVEGPSTTQNGLSVLGPDSSYIYMALGSPANNLGAFSRWKYNNLQLEVGTGVASADVLILAGASSEKIRVKGDTGNVGIGNTTPNAKLQVTGTANISGAVALGSTLAVGNTTATGFANISSTLQVGGLSTFNSNVLVQSTTDVALKLSGHTNSSVSYGASMYYQTDNANRWISYVYGAETGADAGSSYRIGRYSDAGAFVGDVLTLNRTTGLTTLANGLSVTTGSIGFAGPVTGITTLAAGNTTITGFANVSVSVNTALFTVGASFTANSTLVNAAAINVVGQVNTATFFASTSANVGANLQLTTSAIFIGNTTANLVGNSIQLAIANSTASANLGPRGLVAGIVTVNSTAVVVGANSYLSASDYNVGNSIANSTLNNFSLRITNATSNSIMSPGTVTFGNSVANTMANSIIVQVTNATATANLTPAGLVVGNTTINSSAIVADSLQTNAAYITISPVVRFPFGYSEVFDPRLSITRATIGTAETSDGRIMTFAAGEPRITDLGLLNESSKTNLLVYSADLANATYWQTTRSALTANAVTGPDGAQTMFKIVETATSGSHRVFQQYNKTAANTAFTYSQVLKAAERTKAILKLSSTAETNGCHAVFDLLTGTATSVNAAWLVTSTNTVALANGCYRCFLTATTDTDTAINAFIATADAAGSYSYAGDGVSGIYAGLGQLEANSYMSSYIPTTSAAVTRAADNVQFVSGTSGVLGPNMGTIYFEGRAYAWGTDAVDRIMVDWVSSSTEGLGRYSGGSIQLHDGTNYINSSVYTNGAPMKYGVSYSGTTTTASISGATATTATSDGLLTFTSSWGIGGLASTGGSNWDGYIKDVKFYNYALTAAQLQTLTTS